MLQYITQPESRYSIPEQCQILIEGGCGWIRLRLNDKSDAEIREIVSELIPLCKETSTILTIDDRPELAKELGIHGLHISIGSGLDARSVRADLGPEAIIGVEIADVDSIKALQDADIDYISLPASFSERKREDIVTAAIAADNVIPLVFEGNYSPTTTAEAISNGASGIATGLEIMNSSNPVEYTKNILKALGS